MSRHSHFWQPDPKCMLVTMQLGDGCHLWQPGPKCMLVTMQLGDGYHLWQTDPKCMLVTPNCEATASQLGKGDVALPISQL